MAKYKDLIDYAGLEAYTERLKAYLATLETEVDPNDLGLEQDPVSSFVYPTWRGERSENGIILAGGGGGGGGGASTISMTNLTGWLSRSVSLGASCVLRAEWSSTLDGSETGAGSLVVTVGANTVISRSVEQGEFEVDVTPYLASGRNKVRVRVSDAYDSARMLNFTITCVELVLRSSFDPLVEIQANTPFGYSYIPIGAGDKLVHFIVDGNEILTIPVTTSNRQQTQQLPGLTHGSHTLLVYFTADVDGVNVRSNELYYALTVIDESSNVPTVASPFRRTTALQYETLNIPYTVHTPGSLTSQVALKVNGETVSTLTVGRTEQVWSYPVRETGNLVLVISSGPASKTFNISVTESEVKAVAETNDLVLHLSSAGRSNAESGKGVWADVDNDVTAIMSGFNFVSDGWVLDDDGNVALRVSGGASVEIPYKPFAQDFKTAGKTIEVEFATRDVTDYDATMISCVDRDRGLVMTPQLATLTSEQSSISMRYKENEHVRISFVIEKRAENRLAYVVVNGIYSGVVQYPANDNFAQRAPVNISITSQGCTVDIYRIRIYDNDLNRHQILDNWIADTQSVDLMLARYRHNDVYDESGNIVIDKLPSDLPYFILDAAELPQYKGDKKTITGTYVDPQDEAKCFTFSGCQINVQGTSSAPYARKNYDMQFKQGFDFNSGHSDTWQLHPSIKPNNRFVLKADVASSESANNVELVKLFCDADPYKRPEEIADPQVRKGIYGFPIVVFWHDTTTNETTFLGKYNANLPKRAPVPYGYTGDMESWEFQNNTSSLMLFKTDYFDESPRTDPDTGDVKAAWRFDYEARFPEDTWDDYSKLQELQSFVVSCDRTKATGRTLNPSVTYNETRTVIDEVTNPETGTIEYRERVVTEDVEYTTDTAAYRLSRFKHEFSTYAEVDSFLFYWIFTELFLMVDSRAKNLFIGFSGGDATGLTAIDRKAVAEPYDMDTALGIEAA